MTASCNIKKSFVSKRQLQLQAIYKQTDIFVALAYTTVAVKLIS